MPCTERSATRRVCDIYTIYKIIMWTESNTCDRIVALSQQRIVPARPPVDWVDRRDGARCEWSRISLCRMSHKKLKIKNESNRKSNLIKFYCHQDVSTIHVCAIKHQIVWYFFYIKILKSERCNFSDRCWNEKFKSLRVVWFWETLDRSPFLLHFLSQKIHRIMPHWSSD